MKREVRTKDQLVKELAMMRERISGLEASEMQRRQVEAELSRQTLVLDGVNRVLREALFAHTLEEVARMSLAVAEEITGSKFGFLGQVNRAGRFDPVAQSGAGRQACQMPGSEAARLLRNMEIRGIWGRVLKDGRPVLTNDPVTHPDSTGTPEGHPRITSFLGVPLKRAGKTFGMMAVANKERGYDEFDKETLEALSVATAEALTRKEAELQTEESLATARIAVEGTIRALASAVELRDPYTSGHQQRAAKLACHIAREMGLPDEQIEGVHMATLVHDIGKITVPSDILSKPQRLTEIEYNFIKAHPQIGHSLLKNVEFPWPVADIVVQHHERLDGSGYPSGLKSEEILLEAMIAGVADVVEAMASHRPYRPALGIHRALNEILQNSGVLYNSAVVDACARLFLEKDFSFE